MQRLVVVLASVALLLGGSTWVSSATSDPPLRKPAPRVETEGVRHVTIPAGVRRGAGSRNPAVQRVYTPLATPCRLYKGTSLIGANKQLTIPLTACPAIPSYATALDATLTAVGPRSAGSLRVWANGTTEPTVTPLYYGKAPTATSATVSVSSAGLKVHNYTGTTNLAVDVAGYWSEPLYVDVLTASSTQFADVYSSTGMVTGWSSSMSSPGQIVVDFRRDLQYCDIQATAESAGLIATAVKYNNQQVVVRITDSAGTLVRAYASVLVTC